MSDFTINKICKTKLGVLQYTHHEIVHSEVNVVLLRWKSRRFFMMSAVDETNHNPEPNRSSWSLTWP